MKKLLAGVALLALTSGAMAQTANTSSANRVQGTDAASRALRGDPVAVRIVACDDGSAGSAGACPVSGGSGSGAIANNTASGTIAAATLNAAYTLSWTSAQASVGLAISGLTASGAVLTLEYTNNSGNTWTSASVYSGATGLTSAIAADGQFRIDVGGRTGLRLRVSTVGTGTINVTSTASTAFSGIVFDPWNAPFSGQYSITPGGAAVATGRSLKAVCTAGGTLTFTYSDGSTGTWTIPAAGTTVIPVSATAVTNSGVASSCTFANLK